MFKKESKRSSADAAAISTLLGRDIVIEGTLTFQETIRVDGRVSGRLVSEKGTLIVGEQAVLDAEIQVGVAIVRGVVKGRLDAAKRIEIYAPAKVSGDISAPSVAIGSGVVFNGHCVMKGISTGADKALEGPAKTDSAEPAGQKVSKKL